MNRRPPLGLYKTTAVCSESRQSTWALKATATGTVGAGASVTKDVAAEPIITYAARLQDGTSVRRSTSFMEGCISL